MGKRNGLLKGFLSTGALLTASPLLAQYSPTPEFTGKIGKSAETTQTAYPQRNPKAKAGSPNVVWILLDDVGFGATTPFGGLIETPTFDYLAQNGLRYNNFHTTSISAPTRAALLTGRNHHSSHTGMFNIPTNGTPGYDSFVPMENGTIAEVLRENGYATFAVGKYNATPIENGSNAGPFNRWPTGRGFDHYFGYNPATACDDQWHPFLFRDTQREPDDSLGQLAITRFTNEAIQYIADEKSAAPDQPFFLYYAPGTAHYPHQTTPEWINKYKGKFDDGWDEYARKVLENQIRLGIVPKDTKLPVRNKELQTWKSLSDKEKKVFAHQMEVYAGFLSQADYEVGRIVDFLREINQLDNTIIILAIGDNGATLEGGRNGKIYPKKWDHDKAIDTDLNHADKLGDETTYPFYHEAWSAATNTPFRYWKMYADYEGGTHNGLIAFYPKGIKEKGGIRTQYTHCIDIFPTTVELTDSKVPETINGYKQNPVEGYSFASTVLSADNNQPETHTSQYYELLGSYAYYKDGWKVQFPNDANLAYRVRGEADTTPHLYNLKEDFNESKDLAKKYPEKVKELQEAFEADAWKYNVYPLFDSKGATSAGLAFAPVRRHFEIFVGPKGYAEYPYLLGTESQSYSLTAEIDAADSKASGVLFSNIGNTYNFSFYLKDGLPVYAFRQFYDVDEIVKIKGSKGIASGKQKVRADVDYDKTTQNVTITLYVNDEQVGKGTLPHAGSSTFFSLVGPALQVGRNYGPAISDEYKSPYLFTANRNRLIKGIVDIK